MKKQYEIEIVTKTVVFVEAEDEDTAIEKAWEEAYEYGPDESNVTIMNQPAQRVDLGKIALAIEETLKDEPVGDPYCTSGVFCIAEYPDGSERTVEVYKDDGRGTEPTHYIVRCAYEDGIFDYECTDNLSVGQLEVVIRRFAEMVW